MRKLLLFVLAFLGIVLVVAVLIAAYMTRMPGSSYSGTFEALNAEETTIRDNLRRHVESLAGTIGERNMDEPENLREAVVYIRDGWRFEGYGVGARTFRTRDQTVANLIAEIPGQTQPDNTVIVGAHYDSVRGCPGANDNASGVAALLEIARLLNGALLDQTVRFVAFVNEEPPYFQTDDMGSLVYARELAENGEAVTAMLSLETIGYYSTEPGSQDYPFPLALLYPDQGDFIAFVGDLGSRSLVRRVAALFRKHARFPSVGGTVPASVPGIGWSDHWSFWQAGYPAIMITDTALFRDPHYHEPEDTPEHLDYDRMARVVLGLSEVVRDLAGRAS